MYAVIFEVEPRPGREQDYLEIAAALRSDVEEIDGFISIERFESLTKKGKLVSVSFWRDADAVQRWREHAEHHAAQPPGPRRHLRRLPHLRRRGRAPIRHVRPRRRAALSLTAR